jgi:hypothetical protein
VTLKDLQDLSLKINVEIIRLQASGASDSFADMNLSSRVNNLIAIKKTVDDLIADVQSGRRLPRDIPFTRADIARFLPAMSNPNTALPQLIKDAGGNQFLNSLFPKFAAGDINSSAIAKQMFDAYGQDFFKNLSWDIGLSYKGQAERDIAANYATAAADNAAAAANEKGVAHANPAHANAAPATAYRGLLASVVSSQTGITPTHVSAGMGGAPRATTATSGPPQNLDWKERSKQICGQITARGMDPNDFGCLASPDTMKQESFSWRGYARMVCNRLNTVYDTSVPALCGCPPPTWPGWRQ